MLPLLPPEPPALTSPAPAIWDGLDAFLATRVHPASDASVVAALKNLYGDSALFRKTLEALARELPRAIFQFKTTSDRTFGDLDIRPTKAGYWIVIQVQDIPALRKQDHLEPWVAGMVFSMLEVSRRYGVIEEAENSYLFSDPVVERMWAFQGSVRAELKKARPQAYPHLHAEYRWLYRKEILGMH